MERSFRINFELGPFAEDWKKAFWKKFGGNPGQVEKSVA
jgi:hypothetical protein